MNLHHHKAEDASAESSKPPELINPAAQFPQDSEVNCDSVGMPKMIGHFRVEKKLGAGGMSVVYKCTDLAVNRTVAIKVLQARLLSEEKWILRFQQEAKAIGRLSHPNIVSIHHFDAHGDEPYIAMDYVDGQSLDDLMRMEGSLSVERSVKLVSQLMSALAHAHLNRVVHRDLKPSNVMVVNVGTDSETIKLLDFGIAKITVASEHKLTQTGEVFGSPLYMSPEQCQGKAADELSDQYSVGCILYECVTGCPPFSGESSLGILMKHINDEPSSLSEGSLGKQFDPSLESVVRKMLQKDPLKRFASISEAAECLNSDNVSEKSETLNNSKPMAKQNLADNKPFLIATAVGGAVLACLLLILLMIWFMKSEPITGKPVELESVVEHAGKEYGDEAAKDYLQRDNNITLNYLNPAAHNWKRITDKSMVEISRMPNLKRLDLTNCGEITAAGLATLATAPKIEELILNGTQFDDKYVPVILNMKSLLYLSLNGTKIQDEGLRMLSGTKLRGLDLKDTNLGDGGCKSIAAIKTIQRLDISKNPKITKEGIIHLANMPALQFLDLRDDRLSANDIEPLRHMKTLHELVLSRH